MVLVFSWICAILVVCVFRERLLFVISVCAQERNSKIDAQRGDLFLTLHFIFYNGIHFISLFYQVTESFFPSIIIAPFEEKEGEIS